MPSPVPPAETARLSSVEWQVTRRQYPSEAARDELSTAEGRALLAEAAHLGATRVLLSGGDPTARPDLVELIAHGASMSGGEMAIHLLAPTAPEAVHRALPALRAAGLSGLSVSLHGADRKAHDSACSVTGSFAATVELLQAAREEGLSIEVRTALLLGRLRGLPAMAEVVSSIGASRWTVLAPLGGAGAPLGALTLERALVTLADLAAFHRFDVAAVAAPHLARIVRMRHGAAKAGPASRVHVERDGVHRLYISAAGDISPSAELPLVVGRVRGALTEGASPSPLRAALDTPVITSLETARDHLTGRCAVCSFQRVCGGSRARAFAAKADLWAEDPSCAYTPKKPLDEDTE